jgi:hypothetical protein
MREKEQEEEKKEKTQEEGSLGAVPPFSFVGRSY